MQQSLGFTYKMGGGLLYTEASPPERLFLFHWAENPLYWLILPKDMYKEKYFVLDLVTFIVQRSTGNQTLWKTYFF